VETHAERLSPKASSSGTDETMQINDSSNLLWNLDFMFNRPPRKCDVRRKGHFRAKSIMIPDKSINRQGIAID